MLHPLVRTGRDNRPACLLSGHSQLSSAGSGPLQTPLERMSAPEYTRRPDVAVYALTLQLPLEGKLRHGGVVGVIRTAHGRWLHAQLQGSFPDFYISTHEVSASATMDSVLVPGLTLIGSKITSLLGAS